MNKSILILLMTLAAVFHLNGCKDGEDDDIPLSSLEIRVKNDFDQPLDSVGLQIVSTKSSFGKMTNGDGRLTIDKIAIGTYTITYSKKNYVTGSEEIEVKPEKTKIDLVLSSDTHFIRASDTVLHVGSLASSKLLNIESNTSWTVESPAWVKSSVQSGSGNANVVIHWEKSDDDVTRVANVVFKSGSIKAKFKIVQTAPLKLLSAAGIIGNYENSITDSIKVMFNKPFVVKSITTSYDFCLSDIKYQQSGNSVSFTYACGELGRSFPFTISANDGTDDFTFQFIAKFYDKTITIPGYVVDYFITEDNQAIWCITNYPSKILKISLTDMSILKEHELDFPPAGIKWNSLKQTLNVFNHYATCYYDEIVDGSCNSNYLMYLDDETFDMTRSKIKLIDGYDGGHFNYPYVFPKDLFLFKNGTGMIQLANEDNYWGWRFIDSNNSDATSVSQSHMNTTNINYQELFLNHDKTKIYLMHPWGATSIDIYEMGNPVFKTYTSPLFGRSNMLMPHKKINRMFHGQLYEQFISDMDSYVSHISYIDTRSFYGGLDFSYKDGEDETIYYLADGIFQILDYKIGFTSLSIDVAGNMMKIHSTTDGKDLVSISQNSEGTTSIFVFNIDEISKHRAPNPDAGGRMATGSNKLKSRWIK